MTWRHRRRSPTSPSCIKLHCDNGAFDAVFMLNSKKSHIKLIYSNVPKVFVKFADVTLQMRCVTNLKCAQHRQYLANAVEISYVVILMLYIRPCKVTYRNVINLVIYQYGMQTWVAATRIEVLDAKCGLMYVKKGNRDGKIIYECIWYCKEILFPR